MSAALVFSVGLGLDRISRKIDQSWKAGSVLSRIARALVVSVLAIMSHCLIGFGFWSYIGHTSAIIYVGFMAVIHTLHAVLGCWSLYLDWCLRRSERELQKAMAQS